MIIRKLGTSRQSVWGSEVCRCVILVWNIVLQYVKLSKLTACYRQKAVKKFERNYILNEFINNFYK